MDNQIHYKAVIKVTQARTSTKVILPTSLDSIDGKFFIASVAGRLTTPGASKYIHIESTNLGNQHIYVSETGGCGVLASCVLSDIVSNTVLETTNEGVGFEIPTQLYHCPMVELSITDEDYNPVTDIDFVEVTLILICNRN